MRRQLSAIAGVALLALFAVGCEGPQGPQGPEGPEGAEGPQGPAGPAGADGNSTCVQCHTDDTELYVRQVQYENSVHRNGGNFERSTTSCAPCHTHEGFIERIATGEQVTAEDIENPSPPNCRTCHLIHTTYTDADYGLTTTAAVDLWNEGHGTVDFGDGNLCAQCHQPRVLSPYPDIDGGADVSVTNSRWGYHYGTQAAVLGGTGLFEFTGSATITGGPNTHGEVGNNPGGCATCHMATPYGNQAGGHTWNMSYLYHGHVEDNVAGCNVSGCHATPLSDFDYHSVQTDVAALKDSLLVLLTNIGIYNPGSGLANTGTWSANIAAGYINWLSIEKDHSYGVHNPQYVKSVLTNTIETLEPLAPAPGGN